MERRDARLESVARSQNLLAGMIALRVDGGR